MKIAMLAPFGLITKGTVTARILPIANALVERGHQVRVIVPPWDDPPSSPVFSSQHNTFEKVDNVEILTLPLNTKPLVVSLPLQMVREVQNYQPDLIHIFKPKAFSGLAALNLTVRNKKFILDTDDWEGAGGYNDINPYTTAQKLLFAWQERDLSKRAVGVTVASRTLESLIWSMGVKREKVLYLPNGVSHSKYAGWNEPQAETPKLLLQLGLAEKIVLLAYTRFVEFEPKRLLFIFQNILSRLPEDKAAKTCLFIIGSGFHQEEENFRKEAVRLGLTDKIVMSGKVDWKDLPVYLQCAQIALYPFDDNLINRARCSAKLLELLIAERAVVTDAVGENREYIQDKIGGKLVESGDNDAFADAAVELILSQPAVGIEMGKAGAKRVWAKYEWSNLSGPLEKFYNNMLNKV